MEIQVKEYQNVEAANIINNNDQDDQCVDQIGCYYFSLKIQAANQIRPVLHLNVLSNDELSPRPGLIQTFIQC